MYLSKLEVEERRQMHATDGHLEACFLFDIGSKTIHRPPLNRGQIKAGGKHHNKQYQRQKCPKDVFQRTFHAANLRFSCHTTKHSSFFLKEDVEKCDMLSWRIRHVMLSNLARRICILATLCFVRSCIFYI